jgi:hypothetical protein
VAILDVSRRTLILVLILVVMPMALLGISLYLDSNICIVMSILLWVGMVLVTVFLPYFKEE